MGWHARKENQLNDSIKLLQGRAHEQAAEAARISSRLFSLASVSTDEDALVQIRSVANLARDLYERLLIAEREYLTNRANA